jgi:hypothetical protein
MQGMKSLVGALVVVLSCIWLSACGSASQVAVSGSHRVAIVQYRPVADPSELLGDEDDDDSASASSKAVEDRFDADSDNDL